MYMTTCCTTNDKSVAHTAHPGDSRSTDTVQSGARTSTPSRRYSQPRASPGTAAATGRRARSTAVAQGSCLTTPAARRRSSHSTAASSTLSASASCGTVPECRRRCHIPQEYSCRASLKARYLINR